VKDVEPITIPFRQPRVRGLVSAASWLQCKRCLHQARLWAQWRLRTHTPYRALFVLATPRSGSTLLGDYVNSLVGVEIQSEILHPSAPIGIAPAQSNADAAIRHIRHSLHLSRTPIRGCKLMLDHLDNCALTLDALNSAFPDSRYVILYRQSLAAQYLSLESAWATNQWILHEDHQRTNPRVHLDPGKLRSYCEGTRSAYRRILDHAWLQKRSALISYEELTVDPDRSLQKQICPLLDVPVAPLKTTLLKQNTSPLHQRVANYAAIAPLLASPLCHQYYTWPDERSAHRRAA
jgi:LPS sulfotransferase NodH